MTVSDKKEEYQQTLNESFKLLDENQEWIERYTGYISKINSTYFPLQCRFIREIVHINWPLAAYLNITSVTVFLVDLHSGSNEENNSPRKSID